MGYVVPYRTVKYWADTSGWLDRAEQEAQAIAPSMRRQAFAELVFASVPAARYIRGVIDGSNPADKIRTAAALAALDRIGFSPIGNRNPGDNVEAIGSPTKRALALADLTDAELEQHERNLGTGRTAIYQRSKA